MRQGQRLQVVHEASPSAEAPERRRSQFVLRVRPAVLNDTVAGAHIVQEKIAERMNHFVAERRWDNECASIDNRSDRSCDDRGNVTYVATRTAKHICSGNNVRCGR